MTAHSETWPIGDVSRAKIGQLVDDIITSQLAPQADPDLVSGDPAVPLNSVRSAVVEHLHASGEVSDVAALFNEAVRRVVRELER